LAAAVQEQVVVVGSLEQMAEIQFLALLLLRAAAVDKVLAAQ
jgi:hypothetical protein